MHFKLAAVAGLVIALATIQTCPAPLAYLGIVVASVTMYTYVELYNNMGKRDDGHDLSPNNNGSNSSIINNSLPGTNFMVDFHGPKRLATCGCMTGVPRKLGKECCHSLLGEKVRVYDVLNKTGLKIEGLPQACVDVAMYIDGLNDKKSALNTCGDGCIQYSGLSPDTYKTLRMTLIETLGQGQARQK